MMNKKLMITIGLVIAVVITVSLFYMYSPRGLTLIAKERVMLYATEDGAMTWPHPAAIAELPVGQRVPVIKCVDVKHYLIYKVRLPDGREGFVLEGNYILTRNGEEAFCS
jgi:hypothetical protein